MKVKSYKELTLREKIGQTVTMLFNGSQSFEEAKELVERYPIGGVYIHSEAIRGLQSGKADKSYMKIINEYNKYLKVPLILSCDTGGYTDMIGAPGIPSQMQIGQTGSKEVAYMAGEFTAEDTKGAGAHWAFRPVCDLSLSKYDPCTGLRAIGSDPNQVIELAREEIRAMQKNGIAATLKHFPGGKFNCYVDSHLAPSSNDAPLDLWYKTTGYVYRELIKENPAAVMTQHGNLEKYQTERDENGNAPPATISYELATKLLREELGFKGVVVTDALNMGGFASSDAAEKCVQSFLAGNDMLLWPDLGYIDLMEEKILSGEIDESVLDRSLERIWNLKKQYGVFDEIELTSDKDKEYFENIDRIISEKSPALVNNEYGVVPLDKNKIKKMLIVGVTPDDGEYENIKKLKGEFERYGAHCDVVRSISPWDGFEEATEGYDFFVFALCRNVHKPMGPLDFWGDEAKSIWASNMIDKKKIVILNLGTPFVYKYFKTSKTTYVGTCSYSEPTLRAVVKALFGDLEFNGKLTVDLN